MAEWDRRQLCPDGACIGVIGDDGTCKVCGRAAPDAGGAYRSGPAEPIEPDDEQFDDDEQEDHDDARDDGEGGEWSERKLCPDGGCTGVIGDDGKCKVCGRTAA